MQDLPYVVECKTYGPSFEAIAAFSNKQAAESYVVMCLRANPTFLYRVVPDKEITLISELQDALGTEETGKALVEVARNAHKSEMELAARIVREMENEK